MPFWLVASTWAQTGGTGDTAGSGTGGTGAMVAVHSGAPPVTPPVDGTPPDVDTGTVLLSAAGLAGETGGVGCCHGWASASWWLAGVSLLWTRR